MNLYKKEVGEKKQNYFKIGKTQPRMELDLKHFFAKSLTFTIVHRNTNIYIVGLIHSVPTAYTSRSIFRQNPKFSVLSNDGSLLSRKY